MRLKCFILLSCLIFLQGGCFEASAKVYLVSAGISDYPGTANDLTLPANDAKTVSWLYRKNGEVEYKQLLDSEATVVHLLSAMRSVFAKAGTDDIVVFFFSGHGYPGGFAAYDGRLSYGKIRKAMACSRSKSKMIFADACFSGKFRTSGRESHSAVAGAKKANVMLFLSSRSNETSIERKDMKNGFFTAYLQKGLRGGADANRDRVITARELFDYVHRGVVKLSRDKQHPVMWGKFPDSMPVMSW